MKRRLMACLATAVMTGTMWTNEAIARDIPRRVNCRYSTSDGRKGWSDIDVRRTILCAAHKWGVDAGAVLAIAERESGLSWWATNRSSGACGVLQHLRAPGYAGANYWPGRVSTFLGRHPYWEVNPSCYNARSNVVVGVDMMAHGGFSAWS